MTEDFEDYIRERREQTEQTRRLLIGVLAGTCIALAVSNVALALWITSGRAKPAVEAPTQPNREASARAAPVAEPPPSASIPSRAERTDPPPSVTLPKTTEPATTAEPRAPAERAPRTEAPRATQTPRADASRPTQTPRAETPPPADAPASAPDMPPRAAPPSAPAPRASANGAATPARTMTTTPAGPGFAAPEEATAAWMLSTYGRADAEARARAALHFYDAKSSEGRYWRRVLSLITVAR